MDIGFAKGNNFNLPKIDSLMVASFFAMNKDFCAAELRNVKMSLSSRESYGDDAVGYVQIKRENIICIVKCHVCPEHKIRIKPYVVSVVVDEKNAIVLSAQCHVCTASAGGCKHAVAFLMWLHRRSEEPSCTDVQCYWQKSKLSKVGTSLKFITSTELAGVEASTSSDASVYNEFIELATAKDITNCEILRYVQDNTNDMERLSMYHLTQTYKKECVEDFVKSISSHFTTDLLKKIEIHTRSQARNKLWHELRFGRITASKAYEVKNCKTSDGALVALIMGGNIPDTTAMKSVGIWKQKYFKQYKTCCRNQ